MKCEYKYHDGNQCAEETLLGERHCILHVDFPENEDSHKYKDIRKQKKAKVAMKLQNSDFDFEGARLYVVNFSELEADTVVLNFLNAIIITDFWCPSAVISGSVWLSGANVGGSVSFSHAKIGGDIQLNKVQVGKDLVFDEASINGRLWFNETKITDKMSFRGTKILGDGMFAEKATVGKSMIFVNAEMECDCLLTEVKIDESMYVTGTRIQGDVGFILCDIGNVSFENVTINGNVIFNDAKLRGYFHYSLTEIKGRLSFKDTRFSQLTAQETACRKAKLIAKELGNREEVDYHFFREMEARRRVKKWYIGWIEKVLFQWLLQYGTRFRGVITAWFSVVIGCALGYWIFHGVTKGNYPNSVSFLESFYFSIVTVTTLGYGDYHPEPGIFQIIAGFEAIIGTFLWAALIAIAARKYMR
jgi:hypothetical protein